MPEQTQKIRLNLSPQAERYARRDAPREARLLAARGAHPQPPKERAPVRFVLQHDPHPEIKSTARDSLESLPDSVCDTVLSGPAHPALLSPIAHAFKDDASRRCRIMRAKPTMLPRRPSPSARSRSARFISSRT